MLILCNYAHNNGTLRKGWREGGGCLSGNENKGLRAGFTTPTFLVQVNQLLPALSVFLHRAG
jgi:hypothetical protein